MLTLLFTAVRSVDITKNERQAMAQRINILQYNIFMFRQELCLLWRKAGHTYMPSASGCYGKQVGWPARRQKSGSVRSFEIQ